MSNSLGLLPLLCFVLLFLTLDRRTPVPDSGPRDDWRASWLAASVLWGVAVAILTEVLGAAHMLSRPALLAAWAALAVALTARLLATRSPVSLQPVLISAQPGTSFSIGRWWREGTLSDPLLVGLLLVLAVLGTLAVLAPPNNWDSMVYHMSRVIHWMQDRSVDHYPTAIDRQLYLGPWTEFAILHFQLITGNDRWANLVQWMSLPGCAIAASLIARQLGGKSTTQLIAAIVVATMPTAILESTSTQTDLTVAFWVACFVYYARTLSDSAPGTRVAPLAALTAAALGLAILTKATTYLFAVPFGVWLLFWAWKEARIRRFAILAAVGIVALSFSVPHLWRNEKAFGHILGPSAKVPPGAPLIPGSIEYYSNETSSPAGVVSNAIRNIGMHLPTPFAPLNAFNLGVVRRLHAMIGIDMNDPRTSYMGGLPPDNFDIGKPRYHEDRAGNLLHTFLLILSVVIALTLPKVGDARRRGYALALAAAFVLFCAKLKWQPWGTRLQLPLFVLGAPLIAATISLLRPRLSRAATAFVLVACLPWVLFNESRSLLQRPTRKAFWNTEEPTVFNRSRQEQYFRNRRELAEPYRAVVADIEATHCRNVGLVTGMDDWEYPFWALLRASNDEPVLLSHYVTLGHGDPAAESPGYCAVIVTDGADIDASARPALRKLYQSESSFGPITLFTGPKKPARS
jgi:hypothetical protein